MEVVTKIKQNPIEYKVYVAKDGKEFEKKWECEDYERNLYFKELWKILDAKCVNADFFDYYDKFISFKYVLSYDDNYVCDFINLLTTFDFNCEKCELERNSDLNSSVMSIRDYIDNIDFKEGKTYLLGIKYSYDYYNPCDYTEFVIKDAKQCSEKIQTLLNQFSNIFGIENFKIF